MRQDYDYREVATVAFWTAAAASALWLILSLDVETMLAAMLWTLFGVLYPLQYFLSPRRRRSRHWFVQYGAMAAYYLPPHAAFYAANAVYTSRHHNCIESTPDHTAKLALVLLFLALFVSSRLGAGLVNMTAYSLRDGPRDGWRFVQWTICLTWVEWQWADSSWNGQMIRRLCIIFLECSFLVISFLAFPRATALDQWRTKAFADYMVREFKSRSSPFRYPFMQREDGSWISVQDLTMQLRDGDMSLGDVDPDFCLSYSLSRLLARRYFGFPCTEEGDKNVLKSVLAQLGSDCYKKAFTVVEVQLAFLHDYFFTASLQWVEWSMLRQHILKLTNASESIVPLVLAVSWWNMKLDGTNANKSGLIQSHRSDALVLLLLLQLLCFLSLPVHFIFPKYWSPIQIAFLRVNNDRSARSNIWERLIRLCSYIFSPAKVSFSSPPNRPNIYWRNTIGQYSILRDCGRCEPSFKKAAVAWFKEHVLFQPSYGFIKHLPVEEEDVPVPESVRDLVAETLRGIGGPPTNGTRSLYKYKEIARFDWTGTCREETHTDTILIWHIATCYCDMMPRQSDHNREAATALSGYCAYLVAFLPEFLPEHSLTTKAVFQRVLQEARDALATTPGVRHYQSDVETTFCKGVKLARELETQLLDPCLRWKLMAEFWAETMLYIAPSDNAEAHIEHLAQGGEFVTHLWALLSNAGILKRATGDWVDPAQKLRRATSCSW
jgi:hypothetical protein